MTSSSLATTEWPPTPVAPETKALLARFSELCDWNDPKAGLLLAKEVFTSDARMVSPAGSYSGEAEISTCRNKAWDTIVARRHVINKVFTGDSDARELILVGNLHLRSKDNPEVEIVAEFAGRGVVVHNAEGEPRLKIWHAFGGNSRPIP